MARVKIRTGIALGDSMAGAGGGVAIGRALSRALSKKKKKKKKEEDEVKAAAKKLKEEGALPGKGQKPPPKGARQLNNSIQVELGKKVKRVVFDEKSDSEKFYPKKKK